MTRTSEAEHDQAIYARGWCDALAEAGAALLAALGDLPIPRAVDAPRYLCTACGTPCELGEPAVVDGQDAYGYPTHRHVECPDTPGTRPAQGDYAVITGAPAPVERSRALNPFLSLVWDHARATGEVEAGEVEAAPLPRRTPGATLPPDRRQPAGPTVRTLGAALDYRAVAAAVAGAAQARDPRTVRHCWDCGKPITGYAAPAGGKAVRHAGDCPQG